MTDLLTFARQLRAAYSRETSELEHLWGPDIPSTGCCHVTALLIQDHFGGHIIEGDWDGTLHYWNLIDGITIDATRDQFPLEGTLWAGRIADPPLQVTRDKAALLARLAGIDQEKAAA